MLIPARRSRPNGFSLLEMLAVVTLIGILAVLVIPRIGMHGTTAKKNACYQYKGDINAAIERYRFNTGGFPSDLTDLEDPNYYPEAIPKCPVTNTDYTIDPATNRILGHNH